MTYKKIEYEDDENYIKNITLKGKHIKALEKLGVEKSLKFKPFVESLLKEIANKHLTTKKK